MIDTQAIRNKILDLAMRGQLTEQLPEDGTAEELYQQIQAEKQTLAKSGGLYREKAIRSIIPNDTPYSIPKNWLWVRLGELCKVITKGSSPKWQGFNYTDTGNGILFVTSENVGNGQMLFEKRKYVQKQFNEVHPSSILKKGDILTNIVGASIGRTALFDEDTDSANTNQAVCIIRLIDRSISDYVLHYLCGEGAIRLMLGKVVDTARANLSLTSVSNLKIPLPPLAEQQRIVAKIDQASSILDTIDALQTRYADNLTALKAKLIDAAIQGKLTEQLPEDGTAEELYQQIQAEKQALIKEGKIKKEKNKAGIGNCERAFEIPENWRWVSVGDVCVNIQYGSSKKSSVTGEIPVLRMGNIQNGKIVYDKLVYTSDPEEIEKYSLECNDLLFNRTNSMELVGKTAIYKGERQAIYAGYLVRITPLKMIPDYLNYAMQSRYYWNFCRDVRIDSNGQSNINAEKLKGFIFPLPPFEEQKRIVTKLDEVLSEISM